MSDRPLIFISAVSAEHRSLRATVATILHELGYDTTFQDVLPTEHGDISEMLARRLDKCDGVLQLVGQRYGFAMPAPRPEFGPCSYTQFEALYARSKGIKVWYILLDPAHPHDPCAPPCEPEAPELQDLQAAYRQHIEADTHLYHPSVTLAETKLCIHQWRSDLEELRAEWQARMDRQEKEIKRLRPMHLIGALSLIVILGAAIYFWIREKKQTAALNEVRVGQNELIAGQKMDAPSLRAKLAEGSERRLQEDIAAAGKATKSDERQRLRDAAEAAHKARLARIDDLAARLAELTAASGAGPVLVEMTRILKDEGLDPALAYVEKQRAGVLAEVRAAREVERLRAREKLQPLLQAAGLQASKGQSTAARAGYQQVLELEPDWPEALDALGWFLFDQSTQSETHGILSAATADARQCYTVAVTLLDQAQDNSKTQRLLSAAIERLGDVLMVRGQPGDAEQAFKDYTRSLELREALLKANPESTQATRDVSVSLTKLGDFLALRGLLGDAEQALKHYTRSLALRETLLKANPDSALAARDASVSMERLGDFLARRGQPGDAEQALKHYSRSLALRETLLKANPDSAQAARDVSVSLYKLGDFLALHGPPSDAEQALKHYTRSLALREILLKANPDSTQTARDVSVSLYKLGDFLALRGLPSDTDQALSHYTRSLELSENLFKANSDSALAARDVSVSLNRLGDFFAQRGQPGDAEQALKHYTRDLEISETLLKANPDSAQAARDVSVSLNKLGDFLAKRIQPGDAVQAFNDYTRSLELRETLLKANPDSAEAARDVSVSLNKLGDYLARRRLPGDAEQALKHFTRCNELLEALLKANPDSARSARDVSVSLEKLGDFLTQRGLPGDTEQVLKHYSRDLEICETLLKANPDSAQATRDVWVSSFKIASLAEKTGKGDSRAWYQRAYDVLAEMKAKGRLMQTGDEKYLEALRQKLGK